MNAIDFFSRRFGTEIINNEKPVVFNITEIDGLYDITTEDSRGRGYGCRGLSSTEVPVTMQEMSKWMHDWAGFDVVFAFKGGEENG